MDLRRVRLLVVGVLVALATLAWWSGTERVAVSQHTLLAADKVEAKDSKALASLFTKADLESMHEMYSKDLAKNTRVGGLFMRNIKQIRLQAGMVAVIGNLGAMILEGEEAAKAAALRDAGLDLGKAVTDKDTKLAKEAGEKIADWPGKIAPAADPAAKDWMQVIDLDTMMDNVGGLNTATGKAANLSESSFRKATKELEAQAKLLGLLAILARDHDEAEDWKQWCDQMREGSLDLSKVFADRKLESVKEKWNALQKSCDECHKVHRDS